MHIVAAPPFRAASLLWQPQRGAFMLTVVCKATFVLLPGTSEPALDLDPPNDADEHWDGDVRGSLRAASDRVPFKRRGDVVLVGHAYAPRGQPVASLLARLVVGSVDKAIEVHADRAWTQSGQLREGPGFVKMSLRWERAGGGPGTSNPVGVPADARPDRYGQVPLPNLQPPGLYPTRPGEAIAPVGAGPLVPWWPTRRHKLFRHADTWDYEAWADKPLPHDIDAAFFNAAPPDQQVDDLRTDERLVLENLHAKHPRLVTSLPGLSPRAVVKRPGAPSHDVRLRCDTLCIDTDRGVCNLVWRGQVALARPDEAGKVIITAEETTRDEPVQTIAGGMKLGNALPFARPDDEDATVPLPIVPIPDEMPARAATPFDPRRTMPLPKEVIARAVMPFREASSQAGSQAAALAREASEPPPRDAVTDTLPLGARLAVPVLPFAREAATRPAAQPAPLAEEDRETAVPPPPAEPVMSRQRELEIAPPAHVPAPQASVEPPAALPPAEAAAAPPAAPAAPSVPPAAAPVQEITADTAGATDSVDEAVDTLRPEKPMELSIEQLAEIAAEMAEGREARAEVLRRRDLTERAFQENERRWARELEAEAEQGVSRLRAASDRAYVEAVEQLRGPITVQEYARIVIGIERGRPNRALDDLAIQHPALMRIVRVWTKKTAADARLAAEVRALLSSMRGR